MTESTKQMTIAEISAFYNDLNLSIFNDPEKIPKIQAQLVKSKKAELHAKEKTLNFAKKQYAKKLEKEEARIYNESIRYAKAREEARLFAVDQEAKRYAEAQEEARLFAEAQEEAMIYEKANKFYSKNRESPKVKLPSQGRKTPSPPPPTPNFIDMNEFRRITEEHNQYMHSQWQQYQLRPISPPRFFYDKGMMHIINQ